MLLYDIINFVLYNHLSIKNHHPHDIITHLLPIPKLHKDKTRWKIVDFPVQCSVPENSSDDLKHKCIFDNESNAHLATGRACHRLHIPSKLTALPFKFNENIDYADGWCKWKHTVKRLFQNYCYHILTSYSEHVCLASFEDVSEGNRCTYPGKFLLLVGTTDYKI